MQMQRADPRKRLVRITATLAPVYAGLTLAMWVMLMMTGETALTGLIHAMSVMATSGISPVGGLGNAQSGVAGEAILFLFMFFALSRLTFSNDTASTGFSRLDKDPEFRIALMLVIGVPLVLFLRHWWAAFDVNATGDIMLALRALWGSMFTVMSFLTTTGFESADWQEARQWSGLGTPGMILMGLALIGGGVATTAGGVKLLRVYALYLNGVREMEQLVHPSSVSGLASGNRRIQKNGAFIAWVFFMLFALSLALITVVLAALGSSFEQALVLSIATLSTTGPLIDIAAETPNLDRKVVAVGQALAAVEHRPEKRGVALVITRLGIVEVPVGTVRTRLRRAKSLLQTELRSLAATPALVHSTLDRKSVV